MTLGLNQWEEMNAAKPGAIIRCQRNIPFNHGDSPRSRDWIGRDPVDSSTVSVQIDEASWQSATAERSEGLRCRSSSCRYSESGKHFGKGGCQQNLNRLLKAMALESIAV